MRLNKFIKIGIFLVCISAISAIIYMLESKNKSDAQFNGWFLLTEKNCHSIQNVESGYNNPKEIADAHNCSTLPNTRGEPADVLVRLNCEEKFPGKGSYLFIKSKANCEKVLEGIKALKP